MLTSVEDCWSSSLHVRLLAVFPPYNSRDFGGHIQYTAYRAHRHMNHTAVISSSPNNNMHVFLSAVTEASFQRWLMTQHATGLYTWLTKSSIRVCVYAGGSVSAHLYLEALHCSLSDMWLVRVHACVSAVVHPWMCTHSFSSIYFFLSTFMGPSRLVTICILSLKMRVFNKSG